MFDIKELHAKLILSLTHNLNPKEALLQSGLSYDDLTIGDTFDSHQTKLDNLEAVKELDSDNPDLDILRRWKGLQGTDEYYTPLEIARPMWDLLKINIDDKVLDPSAGSGIFGQAKPNGISLEQIELTKKSAKINSHLVDAPIKQGTFQEKSYEYEDNSFDGIITNVPFGKGQEWGLGDKNPLFSSIIDIGEYFIIRSLQLLKNEKRAVFITNTGILSNQTAKGAKRKMMMLGSFIGGYRLPNKIFSGSGADVPTDVLIFEKHPEKVIRMLEANLITLDSLDDVLMQNQFMDGTYFHQNKDRVLGVNFESNEIQDSDWVTRSGIPKRTVMTTKTVDEVFSDFQSNINKNEGTNTTRYKNLESIKGGNALDFNIDEYEKDKALFEMVNETPYGLNDSVMLKFITAWRKKVPLSSRGEIVGFFKTYPNIPSALAHVNYDVAGLGKNEKLKPFTPTLPIDKSLWKHCSEPTKPKYKDRNLVNELIKIYLKELYIEEQSDEAKVIEVQDIKVHQYMNYTDVPQPITAENIMMIDDVFIDEDGSLVPSPYSGHSYHEWVTKINNSKRPNILSVEQFEEKKEKMLKMLYLRKVTLKVENLDLGVVSSLTLVKDVFFKASVTKVAEKSPRTGWGKILSDKSLNGESDTKPTISIASFYGAKGSHHFIKNVATNKAEENAYLTALRHKDKEFFSKYKPQIDRDISDTIKSVDFAVNEAVTTRPQLRKALEEKLESISTIAADDTIYKEDKLYNLRGLFKDDVINTNHNFQNKDIRRFGHEMNGVMRWGTGLGKTRGITGSMLYAIATNKARRGLIVVPNNAYNKWIDHLSEMLTPTALDTIVYTESSDSQAEYLRFIKDRSKKILIIPHSVYSTFSFKEEDIKRLKGTTSDEDRAGAKVIISKIPEFTAKDWKTASEAPVNTIGNFSDSGIEFVIFDEGQATKNSISGGRSYKFAGGINSSRMGVVTRTITALNDGGMALASATPFTSSPYEVFNILKNSGKMEEVENLAEFEKLFMVIDEVEEPLVSDPTRRKTVKMFTGFKSLQLLKQYGLDSVSYRDVETENIETLRPSSTTHETVVEANKEQKEKFANIIDRARLARAVLQKQRLGANDWDAEYEALQEIDPSVTHEDVGRLASTFGQLSSMDKLSINSGYAWDSSLDIDVSMIDKENLEKLIIDIEKVQIPMSVDEYDYNKDGEIVIKTKKYKTSTKDYLDERGLSLVTGGVMTVPKITPQIIKKMIKAGGHFNLDDYPKYKKLMKNLGYELKQNKKAKQLIFSLSILGEVLIEYFIKQTFDGVVKYKIIPPTNQDAYNARKDATFLIFTKKNSTGVDFNINTTSIHLVDIPYTSDVWEQAKGRGVRQGNRADNVEVYQYIVSNTLDALKREILDTKSGWQEGLEDVGDRNTIDALQMDNEVIITKALLRAERENRVITDEDVKIVLAEEKAFREETLKRERALEIDARMRSLKESYVLQNLLLTSPTEAYRFIGDWAKSPTFISSTVEAMESTPDIISTHKKLVFIDKNRKGLIKNAFMTVFNYRLNSTMRNNKMRTIEAIRLEVGDITTDSLLNPLSEISIFLADYSSATIHMAIAKLYNELLNSSKDTDVGFAEKIRVSISEGLKEAKEEIEERIEELENLDTTIRQKLNKLETGAEGENLDIVRKLKTGDLVFTGGLYLPANDMVTVWKTDFRIETLAEEFPMLNLPHIREAFISLHGSDFKVSKQIYLDSDIDEAVLLAKRLNSMDIEWVKVKRVRKSNVYKAVVEALEKLL